MKLKNGSFKYEKVALAVRTKKHQLQSVLKVAAICTDIVATVELLGQWSKQKQLTDWLNVFIMIWQTAHEITMPFLDETLFQVVDVANPAMVDALLEHAPHLIVHGI